MNENNVRQPDGMQLRGSKWYVRVCVDTDLRESFGFAARNHATGHSDKRLAIVRALEIRAEWAARFAQRRRELNPEPLPAVSPELAAELARRVGARVLHQDDNLRSDLPLIAELAYVIDGIRNTSYLSIPTTTPRPPPEPRSDDLMGLRENELAALQGLNASMDGEAAIALSRRNLNAVLSLVKAEALTLGLTFDPKASGAREALEAALKAYRTARHEVTRRDAGEVVDTPAMPSTPAAPLKALTLRDVYNRWVVSGDSSRSKDSIASCNRALVLFETFAPATALKGITRGQGDEFRTWVRAQSKTPKTAHDRLGYLKSLLKYAAQTLDWIPKHPWEGINIEVKTASPRRPWSAAELQTFFTAPLHARYELPNTWHSGTDAAYWIPLLGLFTGARLGELCQLRVIDVMHSEGIAVLRLTDEGELQSIKSDSGRRSIPIHSELVRLGFLDYVETIKGTGAESLWPALRLRGGKPSGFYSNWFGTYRKGLGLSGDYPDFHCFRHTVRPLMRRAGFSESTMDKITGHATGGSVGTTDYDHFDILELQPAVESIRYPALPLNRVAPLMP
jgi:integrase